MKKIYVAIAPKHVELAQATIFGPFDSVGTFYDWLVGNPRIDNSYSYVIIDPDKVTKPS